MNVMLLVSGDLWAGAEAVVYQLAKGLKTQGDIKVLVVCLNQGQLAELLLNAGVHVVVIDEAVDGFWDTTRQLCNIVKRFEPDIMHAHRYKENILAALVSPLCRFPRLVSTIHGISEVKYNMARKCVFFLEGIILRYGYARIVAVSDDLVSYLTQERGISPQKVTRIYNGSELQPAYKNNKTGRQVTIGSAGRLVPAKDFELMVEVARKLCAERENVKFILAGDGPERDALRGRVKSYGLGSCFTLLGHVEDMEGFYSGIDIYLNTSRHEGMPMAIIEAMGRYLPIVAPDVGGIREIVIDQETGTLVRCRDPREFARALKFFVDSPGLIDSMGTKARQRAEEVFSCTSMVRAYSSLYRQLLGQKEET